MLFCLISLVGTASAEDISDNELMSYDASIDMSLENSKLQELSNAIEEENSNEISTSTDMSNEVSNLDDDAVNTSSDAVDGSSLKSAQNEEILSASHDLSSFTRFDQVQNYLNTHDFSDGDILYLGNHELTGNGAITVSIPNIIISGGTEANPTAIATLSAIPGDNGPNIFNLNAAGITLQNLVLRNGNAGSGGAININSNNCIIKNSILENNQAQNGGAIYGSSSASGTIIENCNFTNNFGKWYGTGAAIKLDGANSKVTSCYFEGNSGANGGAIAICSENVAITDCNFNGNTAEALGGAIFLANNWQGHVSGTVIDNCNFTNNIGSSGGAVGLGQGVTNTEINNCLFENNSANGTNDDTGGGAIFGDWNGNTASLNNLTFINNNATIAGGAVKHKCDGWTFNNCNFTNNSAYGETREYKRGGGALWSGEALTILEDCYFEGNEAPYGGAIRGAIDVTNTTFVSNVATDGNGGGIDLTIGAHQKERLDPLIRIDNCTFYNNSALGDYYIGDSPKDGHSQGGAIHIFEVKGVAINNTHCYNNTAYRGGAIDLYVQEYAVISNSTIEDNNATLGGGIAVEGDNCDFINLELLSNTAVDSENDTGQGGGIWVYGSNAEFMNSTLDFNNATQGAGIFVLGENGIFTNNSLSNNTAINGSGIYVEGNNTQFNHNNLTNNTAENGAGIFVEGDNSEFNHNNLSENTAVNGAGIFVEGAGSEFNYNNISYNDAELGGGIYIEGPGNNFTENYISHNTAGNGGGMAIFGDHCDFFNNTIVFNKALSEDAYSGGGGVAVQGDNVNFTDNNISSNTAETGGGLMVYGNNLYIENLYAYNNTAENGGACSVMFCEGLTVKNSTFVENLAKGTESHRGLGGAIQCYFASESDVQADFINNTARNGSAIYLEFSDMYVHDSTFFENQAYSYLLNITPVNNTFVDENAEFNISVSHQGGDNIINAIYNDEFSVTTLNNVTYPFYINGQEIIKTSPTEDIQPEIGAENSDEGNLLYQDDFENNQIINILVKDKFGNLVTDISGTVLNFTNLKTDIYGTVTIPVAGLEPGTYTIEAIHPEDRYYKEIFNLTVIRVGPIDLSINKTVSNETCNVSDLVDWNVTVVNNNMNDAENVTINDFLPEGLDLLNLTYGFYNYNNLLWTNGILNLSSLTLTYGVYNSSGGNWIYGNASYDSDTKTWTYHILYLGDNALIYSIYNKNILDDNTLNYGVFDESYFISVLGDTKYDEDSNSWTYRNISYDLATGNWYYYTFDYNDNTFIYGVFNESYFTDAFGDAVYDEDSNTWNYTDIYYDVNTGNWCYYTVDSTGSRVSNVISPKKVILVPVEITLYLTNNTQSNNNISLGINCLEGNSTVVMNLVTNVTHEGRFTNIVNVTTDSNDSNLTNNIANNTTCTVVPTDLIINKTVSDDVCNVSDCVEWNVTTLNNGTVNASNVTINDFLPDGLDLVNLTFSFYNETTGLWTNGTLNLSANTLLYGVYNQSSDSWIYDYAYYDEDTHTWTYYILNLDDNTLTYTEFKDSIFVDVFGEAVYDEDTNSYNYRNISYNNETGLWSYYIFNYNGNDVIYSVFDPDYFTDIFGTGHYDPRGETYIFDRVPGQAPGPENRVIYYIDSGKWLIGNELVTPTKVTIVPRMISLTLVNDTENNQTNISLRVNYLDVNETVVLRLITNVSKEGNFTNIANVSTVTPESNYTNNVANNTTKGVIERTDLMVTKFWLDNHNQDGIRPDNVTVYLFADGVRINETNLTADGGWYFIFPDLPVYKDGQVINYTVREVPVEGYDVVIDNLTAYVWTVTNTHTHIYKPNMTVQKVANDEIVYVGNVTSFTIIVKNTGDCNLSNVTVTESWFSPGLEFNDVWTNGSHNWTYDSSTRTWTLVGELVNGTTASFDVFFNVTMNGTLSNNVTAKSNLTNDTNGTNQTRAYLPNLTVEKLVNDEIVYVGDIAIFTIFVKNTGDCNLSDVTVTETWFSDGLEFNDVWVPNGHHLWDYDSSTRTWTLRDILPVEDFASFIVYFNVTTNGTLHNNVSAKSNLTNETNATNETRAYLPNMTVSKVTLDKEVYVGNATRFTIVVENTGDCVLDKVYVVDTDYDHSALSYLKYENGSRDWNYEGNGNWTLIGTLAVGEKANFTVWFELLTNGTFINNVTAGSNLTNETNGTNYTTGKPICDLVITKIVNTTHCYVDDLVEWNITVVNRGPSTALDVIVKDVLPEGLELVDVRGGNYDNNTHEWIIGTLEKDTPVSIVLVTKVLVNGTIKNPASVSTTIEESNYTNNNDSDTTKADYLCDLIITKDVNCTSCTISDLVEWNITVVNLGPHNASNVIVKDILPKGLELIKYEVSVGNFNEVISEWSIGTLEKDTPVSLILVTKVLIDGTFVNIATVNTTTPESNYTNNRANDTTRADPICDLVISKSVNATKVIKGEYVKWTIKVTNKGPSTAYDVEVKDILPKGLKLIAYRTSTGKYQNGVWTIGKLIKGSTVTLTLITKTTIEGNITNIASVSTTTPESNHTNNEAKNTTEALPPVCDLVLYKSSDKTKYNVDDTMHWIIKVVNKGPNGAVDVYVKDVLPRGTKFVSFTSSKGSFDVTEGVWKIGDLAKGEEVTLIITCKVLSAGSITNEAVVNSSVKDLDTSNNKDNATIEVAKKHAPNPAKPKITNLSLKTGNPLVVLLIAFVTICGGLGLRRRKE